MREALECAAVRIAAVTRRSRRTSQPSRASCGARRRLSRYSDFERFAVLDDEFHAAICELSGHGFTWEVAQRAKGHLSRVRRLSLPQPDYLGEMLAEHQIVLAALRRHEPDEAESALRHHLRMVLPAVPRIRAAHPEYFEDEA